MFYHSDRKVTNTYIYTRTHVCKHPPVCVCVCVCVCERERGGERERERERERLALMSLSMKLGGIPR